MNMLPLHKINFHQSIFISILRPNSQLVLASPISISKSTDRLSGKCLDSRLVSKLYTFSIGVWRLARFVVTRDLDCGNKFHQIVCILPCWTLVVQALRSKMQMSRDCAKQNTNKTCVHAYRIRIAEVLTLVLTVEGYSVLLLQSF